jgi:hypothetical protein
MVSWEARYDRRRRQPDAKYAAMEDFFRMGEKAFRQERQCEPTDAVSQLYAISATLVSARTNGLERRVVPDGAAWVTAGIDVNTECLSWVVCGINRRLTTWVVDYGIHPPQPGKLWTDASGLTQETAIARGVEHVVKELALRYPGLYRVAIDGNWGGDTIYPLAETLNKTLAPHVVVARGVFSKSYYLPPSKKLAIREGEQCHMFKQHGRGESMWFNSHHWHRVQQAGFLLGSGVPGSVSFFGAADARHRLFAEAVCADRLLKVEINSLGKEVHSWETDERYPNHLSDALVMAMVSASIEGASTNADLPEAKAKSRARIVRVGGGDGSGWRAGSGIAWRAGWAK